MLDRTDSTFPTVSTTPVPVRVEPGSEDLAPQMPSDDKLPYSVPSMAEIAKSRATNGYKVISTFSGCGGSCLGFEMEGFEVLWASEFIDAAREAYELNHPGVPVDSRDIRNVEPAEILAQIGIERGEIDVLEGSPPCASFSTAGKLAKAWGEVRSYSETKQRVDDLFWEFTRILDGLQPKVFIAENVAGLARGVAKGYFLAILAALKSCGYNVETRILDAQWLGVPQTRKRLIFVGVRNDLEAQPRHPSPLPYRYSLRDAIGDLLEGSRVIHDTSGEWSTGDVTDKPCPAVTIGVNGLNSQHFQVSEMTLDGTAIGKEWDKLRPGQSSDKYFNLIKPDPKKPSPVVTQTAGVRGAAGVTHPTERRKFTIQELKRVCAFPDDFQLTGSYRQQWERLGRAVPPVMMAAVARCVREILDEC